MNLKYLKYLKPTVETIWALALGIVGGTAFYLTTKAPHQNFDYTYRIAQALLSGHVGLDAHPGSWLNELVPFEGKFYSVFPFGAVLTNLPWALLRKMELIREWPARTFAALVAGGCVYFCYRLTFVAQISRTRRVLLALAPLFATFAWANLGFAGAWQIALGFALLGQTAGLYFTLVSPRPILAGLFFALAFGNRVELVLVTPLFLYFWFFRSEDLPRPSTGAWHVRFRPALIRSAKFLAIPALMLMAMAAYNYVRFHSVSDFGYARIPGVLNEPWYRHGLFSYHAIPWNVHKMLFEGVADHPQYPYMRFFPFGCSIFVASPLLFLLFREGGKHRLVCWLAILGLTLVLWLHGNPGGWQYSYRYAMILLPWIFLLMIENGPRRLTATETGIFLVSVYINAIAVYEFLWSSMIHV
jgi:hypothetical protein